MEWDDEIDASGLLCPLPVLRLRKRMQGLPTGTVVRLLSTDPAAAVDVPHFCAENGHELLNDAPAGQAHAYLIRKRGA